MTFRIKDKSLNDYNKVYTGEVVARYVNGYKVRVGNDTQFILNREMEIITASQEETQMPIVM